jgi:hypothetical protein
MAIMRLSMRGASYEIHTDDVDHRRSEAGTEPPDALKVDLTADGHQFLKLHGEAC